MIKDWPVLTAKTERTDETDKMEIPAHLDNQVKTEKMGKMEKMVNTEKMDRLDLLVHQVSII